MFVRSALWVLAYLVVAPTSSFGAARQLDTRLLGNETGTWRRVSGPDSRRQHAVVYDPIGDQLLVHGGNNTDNRSWFGDTWSLGLSNSPAWKPTLTHEPGDRYLHTSVIDAAHHRMIVFGGQSGIVASSPYAFVLTLDGTPAWNRVTIPGGPGRISKHSAIYDPLRDRMLIFGGSPEDGVPVNTVWAWSTDPKPEWTLLQTAGAPPIRRYGAATIYDPIGDRMIVFGGWTIDPTWRPLNDVWALSLAGTPTWVQLDVRRPPPSPRGRASGLYDSARHRMLILGGFEDELWSLDLGVSPSWSQLDAPGLPYEWVVGQIAAYDPVRDRIVLFGGYENGYEDSEPSNKLFALNLAEPLSWKELYPPGAAPLRVAHPALHFDAVRNRLLAVAAVGNGPSMSVYACDVALEFAWSRMEVTGNPPTSRGASAAAYDPIEERFLLIGGILGGDVSAEVWELRLDRVPVWRQLDPDGPAPPGFRNHVTAYDTKRNRVIAFGGRGSYYDEPRGTWSLNLEGHPRWEKIAADVPGRPEGGAGIYDPELDRLLLFGGYDGASSDAVWTLPLAADRTWQQLDVPDPHPSPRYFHSAIHDPSRRRMVVFGGFDNDTDFGDAWALALGDEPTWTLLSNSWQPGKRSAHGAAYDPLGDRMIIFGGWAYYAIPIEGLWTFEWGNPSEAPLPAEPASALTLRCEPNPFLDQLRVRLGSVGVELGRVEILDISGRRIRSLIPNDAAWAAREVYWDGHLENGASAPGGIYFVRSVGGDPRQTARVVRLVR